uniref:Uncharacterized protein n=1 Tax=Mus musculus TaxID=10090 RepID=Q8CA97_MOUSE|nr:unnamed protein product [Mus musculus]
MTFTKYKDIKFPGNTVRGENHYPLSVLSPNTQPSKRLCAFSLISLILQEQLFFSVLQWWTKFLLFVRFLALFKFSEKLGLEVGFSCRYIFFLNLKLPSD